MKLIHYTYLQITQIAAQMDDYVYVVTQSDVSSNHVFMNNNISNVILFTDKVKAIQYYYKLILNTSYSIYNTIYVYTLIIHGDTITTTKKENFDYKKYKMISQDPDPEKYSFDKDGEAVLEINNNDQNYTSEISIRRVRINSSIH
jgi:hypothetical protein